MTNGSQSTTSATGGRATDRAQEIYDQLLSVGQEVAAAYVDAYQKTAAGVAEFQDKVAQGGGWPGGVTSGPGGQPMVVNADAGESLRNARRRALEISEKLQEMNRKVMLAYLNALELAALAVADCQQELAATSDLEIVKAVNGAGVAFRREMTKACVSAAREIVA